MRQFTLRLLFLGAIALTACQPPAPSSVKQWCDFEGTKPAQAPKMVTGAWSFLRCYGDGRLEKSVVCIAFGDRGGVATKPSDNTLQGPLYHDWSNGRLILRTCAPGDTSCAGFTFTLDTMDPYTMYGTFTDGKVTGKARATLEAARDCDLRPDEPFIPEVTPSPPATAAPEVDAAPSPSMSPSPIPSPVLSPV